MHTFPSDSNTIQIFRETKRLLTASFRKCVVAKKNFIVHLYIIVSLVEVFKNMCIMLCQLLLLLEGDQAGSYEVCWTWDRTQCKLGQGKKGVADIPGLIKYQSRGKK